MPPLTGTARTLSAIEAATASFWAVAIRSDAQRRTPPTLRWLSHPGDDTIAAEPRPDEIELWMAAVNGAQAEDTSAGHLLALDKAAAFLAPDETDRLYRFVHEEDRRSYAAAHGGARRLLARILQQPPEALRFSTSAYGKPILSPPVSALDFNISHARGVVAVAVAQRPVGVDVEPLRTFDGMDGMSDLVLSPQEQVSLRNASDALRPKLFLRYWTLKEALLKAAGAGFSIAPNLITLDIGTAPAALSVPAQLGDPAQWQLVASEL